MNRDSSWIDRKATAYRDDRVGGALLGLVAVVSLCIAGWLLVAGEARRSVFFVPIGLLVVTGFGFLLRGRVRASVALLLLVLAPLPWMSDWALAWLGRIQAAKDQRLRREYAAHSGTVYDGRTPKQVIEDLRQQNRDAWPAVHPAVLLERTSEGSHSALRGKDGRELQPLGGIAQVETVYGNENGQYLIYHADEHGFQNPPGIWSKPSIDVAAVGDSFTHGASVDSTQNLVAVVRQRWPSTLNLGYGGNGPLLELASLLEYLPKRQPRAVLWVLCEGNDLGEDLEREMDSPLLVRYWKEARALQKLEERQAEIDTLLRAYAEASRRTMDSARAQSGSVTDFLALERLRQTAYTMLKPPHDRWDVFEEILQIANNSVRSWRGDLYLVYLPVHYVMREGWLARRQRGTPEQRRQRVLEIGRRLRIQVIDLEPVFQTPQRATYLYPFYPAHFTAAGYHAIGRAIVAQLEGKF